MKLKEIALFSLFFFLFLFFSCFPEREPTKPDFKGFETRRPSVAYHSPVSNATDVPLNTKIEIWFDELMDEASVERNFQLWPKVSLDSLQTMAVAPQNPDVIFVSRKTQGIFKSTDRGESWVWLTPRSMKFDLSQLVISPLNENLLYAVSYDSGLFRSDDGGFNWQKISLPVEHPLSIELDPVHEGILYVATERDGLLKSADGGDSWEAKNDGIRSSRAPRDIAINPLNPNTLYLATKGDFVLKSTNGGDKWTRLRQGFLTYYFDQIYVHPADTSRLYAISDGGGVYLSRDAGENWQLISEGLTSLQINAFAFDPLDTTKLILNSGDGLFQSNNGGLNWVQSEQLPIQTGITQIVIHGDNPESIFAATDAGVFVSQSFATGWTEKNNIPLTNLYVQGNFLFSKWQDSTLVTGFVNASTTDTTIIFPFIYERALAAWIANGKKGEPPVEANPTATKMEFNPIEKLIPQTQYQARIVGTFEKDKETIRQSFGASDVNGNSFETDYNFIFTTGKK